MRQRVTYAAEYQGHPLQTNRVLNQGCIENIVEGFHEILEYMTGKYKQVSVMQLVVSPPASIPAYMTNRVIGEVLNALKKNMANRNCELQAGWVREVAETASPDQNHYHIGIIVDGSKCQSAVGMANTLRKLIKKRSNEEGDWGNVHYCIPDSEKYNRQELKPIETYTAIKIRTEEPYAAEQFDNALNWLSYIAKTGIQKDRLLPGRGYGFTLLRKANNWESFR